MYKHFNELNSGLNLGELWAFSHPPLLQINKKKQKNGKKFHVLLRAGNLQWSCCGEGRIPECQASTNLNQIILSSELVLFPQDRPRFKEEPTQQGWKFGCFWKESGYIYSQELFSAQGVQQPLTLSLPRHLPPSPLEIRLQCPSHYFFVFFCFSDAPKSLFLFLNHSFIFQGHGKFRLWKCYRFISFSVIRIYQLVNISNQVCGCYDLSQLFCGKRTTKEWKKQKKPVNSHLHANRDNMLLFPQCTNINCSQSMVNLQTRCLLWREDLITVRKTAGGNIRVTSEHTVDMKCPLARLKNYPFGKAVDELEKHTAILPVGKCVWSRKVNKMQARAAGLGELSSSTLSLA